MRNVRVPLFGNVAKSVTVDPNATDGAVVGINLRRSDGSLVTDADLAGGTSAAGTGIDTTDDLDEGGYNLYFTAKRAQDAVGGILTDTDTIDFTYDGTAHVISADLKTLSDSGVGALVGITRDAKGRVSGTRSVVPGDGVSILDNGAAIAISIVGLPVYVFSQSGDQITDQGGNLLIGNQTTGLPVDWSDITTKPTTVAGYGITDAQVVGTPIKLPRYTFAGKPSAATFIDTMIIISDLSGGPAPCWSNGTNWLLVGSNAIASP